jgi:AraC-like DNA-binding protein/mannose-6-phosphate isomerase-like protein (cupin superfamily)
MSEKRSHIEVISLPEYTHTDPTFVVSGLCELGKGFFDNNGIAHRHDFYTIYWIKKGQVLHTIDTIVHPVKQNTLFLLAPGQVHKMEFSEKVEGYMIAFQENFMCLKEQSATQMGINSTLFFNNQFSSVITLTPEYEKDFEMLVHMMMKELMVKAVEYETAIHGLLRYFLVLASRIKGSSIIATPEQHASHNGSLFLQFRSLIDEQYTTIKNVSDYADLLHVKPVLLNEVSKQLSGITAGEHIRNRVILEAQRYLYNTDLSAKEIAYKLGFDDPHYFSRFFKKYTSQTPSEFKEASRANV